MLVQLDGGGGWPDVSGGLGKLDLAGIRLSELKAFLLALESPVLLQQLENDETFVMVVQLAIDDYGIGQGEIAEVLQTQTSTVGRWKQGRAVPSIYSRAGIVSAIASLLAQHITERVA